MNRWKILNNPPIVVALFQLKYNTKDIKLDDFLRFEEILKHNFPIRKDNINVGINLAGSSIPLGVSKISGTSDAKIGSYLFLTTDQKVKIELSEGSITYIDERPYKGWDSFKLAVIENLKIFCELINNREVIRISIRYINRFSFDNFDHPQDYFRTLISGTDDNVLSYPLRQYTFRLTLDVPNTDIYSIVNQNVESDQVKSFLYTFDIDVLDKQRIIFDINTISENMEILRNVKNEIFFNNVTSETIDLCK